MILIYNGPYILCNYHVYNFKISSAEMTRILFHAIVSCRTFLFFHAMTSSVIYTVHTQLKQNLFVKYFTGFKLLTSTVLKTIGRATVSPCPYPLTTPLQSLNHGQPVNQVSKCRGQKTNHTMAN